MLMRLHLTSHIYIQLEPHRYGTAAPVQARYTPANTIISRILGELCSCRPLRGPVSARGLVSEHDSCFLGSCYRYTQTARTADYLARDGVLDFGQEDMPYFRRRMVVEILRTELMDE